MNSPTLQTLARPTRRAWLRLASGATATAVAWVGTPRPAAATAGELGAALARFTGGAPVQVGRITLEVAELVENGNSVPITMTVASPMTPADHVVRLALFTERNPQPEVLVFQLGPRAGRAHVATRVRLATSQPLVALAQLSDGTFWSHRVEVIVTLAACVEA